MEKKNSNVRTISVMDMWEIFVKRCWLMLIAAVITITAMFLFVKFAIVPDMSLQLLFIYLNSKAKTKYQRLTFHSRSM